MDTGLPNGCITRPVDEDTLLDLVGRRKRGDVVVVVAMPDRVYVEVHLARFRYISSEMRRLGYRYAGNHRWVQLNKSKEYGLVIAGIMEVLPGASIFLDRGDGMLYRVVCGEGGDEDEG